MWKQTVFVTTLLFSLSLGGLTACKSEGQKTIDHAHDLVATQGALVNEINGLNRPSVSSSDADINYYESKINQLANTEAQLKAMNGCSNGACISTSGYNDDFIANARTRIASVRAQKRSSAPQAKPDIDKIKSLMTETDLESKELQTIGMPDTSWELPRLKIFLQKLEKFRVDIGELSRQMNSVEGLNAIQTYKANLQARSQAADILRDQVNTLIGKKMAQEDSTQGSNPNDKIKAMMTDVKAMEGEIRTQGSPDPAWSTEKLEGYISKCDALKDKYSEMKKFLEDNGASITSAQLYKERMEQAERLTSTQKAQALLAKMQKMMNKVEQQKNSI